MCPHLENYGNDDDLHLVITDLPPGVSLEVTGDGDHFWVSLRAPDGRLLDDAAINPRAARDTTYDKHRYATADYPEPQDVRGTGLRPERGASQPAELASTVYPGQYLTRVDSVTAGDLARGASPDEFPTVDDARSFVAMYVLELPPEPVVDDEPVEDEERDTERTDYGPEAELSRELADTPNQSADPTTHSDSRRTESLTLFDLVMEEAFEVSVADFTAHYGVTVWNTGQFWHE